MIHLPNKSRRRFLAQAAAVGALSAGAWGDLVRTALAAPGEDYKALVCLFLFGGNDSNNLLIPTDARYATYQRERSNLALAANTLLPLNGAGLGLHQAMPGLQGLFNQQKAAFLANVGPLVAPVSKAQFQARSVPLPPNLFSHSDQVQHWQSGAPDRPARTGWAGRIIDQLAPLNDKALISPSMSVSGSSLLQRSERMMAFQLTQDGTNGFSRWIWGERDSPADRVMTEFAEENNRANLLEAEYADVGWFSLKMERQVKAALSGAPQLATAFPNSGLGNRFKIIARTMAVRASLGVKRQVFFVSLGGFDTHGDQLGTHNNLLAEINSAVAAFYNATVELGIANQVTTFSASDFNRTLKSNGKGSDHGWGGHHFIVGGAVNGGKVYGRMPELGAGSADDVGDGRFIPSTSVDEYGATLARWFGVPDSGLATVFPNLGRFATPNLGFMA